MAKVSKSKSPKVSLEEDSKHYKKTDAEINEELTRVNVPNKEKK